MRITLATGGLNSPLLVIVTILATLAMPVQNVSAETVISTISVGNGPGSIDVNPDTKRTYVANYDEGSVSVIAKVRGEDTVTATIPVGTGSHPSAVRVNQATNRIYVAGSSSDSVYVIDGFSNTVVANISGVYGPASLALNPKTNKVYVGGVSIPTINVIDGSTNKVIKSFDNPCGSGNNYLGAVDTIRNKIYGTCFSLPFRTYPGQFLVFMIDGSTDTVTRQIALTNIARPCSIALNPNTNMLYVGDYAHPIVYLINGDIFSLAGIIGVDSTTSSINVNPSTNRIYVSHFSADSVSVIDGMSNLVLSTVAAGDGPAGVAVNPKTNWIYVANSLSNTVTVLDGNSSTNAIP